MFAAGRGYEIIRNSIAHTNLNVKIGATHAGISVGEDGATHQCIEDIALMRVIPNMTIINPADDIEARTAVLAMAEHNTPVYFRFGRLPVPDVNGEDYQFRLGKGVTLRDGNDVAIIATGICVNMAVEAAKILEKQNIYARVINIHTIKPLDNDIILKAAAETGKIVTVEEHSIIGGLGSAVCEVLAENPAAHHSGFTAVKRIGINDTFGCSGPAADLLLKFGLSADNIVSKVTE
jgi:transketolase